jgi:hypothetical protein
MKNLRRFAAALIACTAGAAFAQPAITSLGGGNPTSVTNSIGGTIYIGGSGLLSTAADRWSLTGSTLSVTEIGGAGGSVLSADGQFATGLFANTGPTITGNTATGVTPAFNPNPTLVPAPGSPATTELAARLWSSSSSSWTSMGGLPIVPSLICYGSGSSGSSSSAFLTANTISATGRFSGGLAYVCTYNNAGTAVSASTFRWRPWIWDAQANGGLGSMICLPTPFRSTAGQTSLRRTGNVFAISADGLVILGAQEHNSAVGLTADPDGARLVVWRWNAATSTYDMTFLPNGTNGSGFPYTYGMTPAGSAMNQAGTIIVSRASDASGTLFLGKWVWNSSTSSWDPPINLGSNLTTPASWLPLSVTSCAIPPSVGSSLAMSEDGNTIVGQVTYSTCGSFMSGGFIWTPADGGTLRDWYDYNAALGTPGCTPGGIYGPIGDNSDPTKGLCRIGFPVAISPDGTNVVGVQGGTQIIAGARPWIEQLNGGPSCVSPTITTNPTATINFSRCLSAAIFNAGASGSGVLSYQWFKSGNPVTDGTASDGAVTTGATTFQMRITNATPNEAGTYYCVNTGCNGATAQTTNSVLQPDPAAPIPANDTCATATAVGEGTFNFNICGAYVNDGFSTCNLATEIADVWYAYTPTFTGNARITTCASAFNTTLTILSGCNGNILACNDDVGSRGQVSPTCSSNRSVITPFAVTAGVPVLIRVGVAGSLFGTPAGAITISHAPLPPGNDNCATPADISGAGAYSFDLSEATDDFTYGVNLCSTSTPAETTTASNRDVWFRLNAPCGGTFSFYTCGSTISNPMLHIVSDCSGNILACRDNIASGTAVAPCVAGNQAQINNFVATGPVLIRVSASGLTAPNSGLGTLTVIGTPTTCTHPCGTADFDCNGDLGTDTDIAAFFACLSGNCPAAPCTNSADFNGDGDIGTDTDIEAFFRVLSGGTC